MRRSFPQIEAFAVKGPWKSVQSRAENVILFSGAPLARESFSELVNKVSTLVEQHRLPPEAVDLLKTRRTQPWPVGTELSDDFAPFDLLMGSGITASQPESK
jgi:hypothetical protein